MLRVAHIVGTRPNLVKIAPLLAAERVRPDSVSPLLIHTGQHSEPAMSDGFLRELELPEPDVRLAVRRGGPEEQIAAMVIDLERTLADLAPDLVLVVGDVTSTAAGALAAAALSIPVGHVEAGLRSFDRTMPEERNRIVADGVSDLLFASEESAVTNLVHEGRRADTIHHVGNVMIDALVHFRARSAERDPAGALGLTDRYAVVTLHRPANVDAPNMLQAWLHTIGAIARRVPVIFPVHPRTRHRLDASGLGAALGALPGVHAIGPAGYLDMLALQARAELVLTDSGGMQEETTFLGVPCLTLRDNTERPATVTHGTNRVVGTRREHVLAAVDRILAGDRPTPRRPPLWDGHAAERIIAVLTGAVLTGCARRSAPH